MSENGVLWRERGAEFAALPGHAEYRRQVHRDEDEGDAGDDVPAVRARTGGGARGHRILRAVSGVLLRPVPR